MQAIGALLASAMSCITLTLMAFGYKNSNEQSFMDGVKEAFKSFKLSPWLVGQLCIRIPIVLASLAVAFYLLKQARTARTADGKPVDVRYRIACGIGLPFSLIPGLIALVKWV